MHLISSFFSDFDRPMFAVREEEEEEEEEEEAQIWL